MEKLELKHLSPYLPYGVKVSLIDQYGDLEPDLILEIESLGQDYADLSKGFNTMSIHGIKPILRPLSDLTKEIEHNGEKFVPIQELFQIAYEDIYTHRFEGVFDEDDLLKERLALKASEEKWNYGFTVELPNQFLMTANGDPLTIPNFTMYQKLFEWHFDVFGLLDAGLAIKKH